MVGHVSDAAEALPPLGTIPPDLRTLADYERVAARHMPAASWHHVQSGAGRELTLARNRAAFDEVQLLPRVLADLRGGGTELELFGRRHAAPILFAPVAYQRLAHPEGELATARAAAAMGLGLVASTLSSFTLEEIAAASRGASRELGRATTPLWFQLYLQEERSVSAALVDRAEAAGYEAIVLTVDASVKTAGFVLPEGVTAANLPNAATRQQTATGADGRRLFGTPLADRAPTWDDVAWLRARTRLPLLVKGILAIADAVRALEHGADGLVVSNHGGRILDGAPSAIDVLPAMVEAARGAPLLIDGGVRSGGDVVKALALGAKAVLVGRPQMHALAVAGMAGVAHIAHLLRGELELAQAQLGCARVDQIGPDSLYGRVR